MFTAIILEYGNFISENTALKVFDNLTEQAYANLLHPPQDVQFFLTEVWLEGTEHNNGKGKIFGAFQDRASCVSSDHETQALILDDETPVETSQASKIASQSDSQYAKR